MKNIILPVTEIQRFCMHDGPGVRTTVFFKGCPLRCKWCHNPETQSSQNEILYYPQKCIGCGLCAQLCSQDAHSLADGKHIFDRSLCQKCGKCAQNCPVSALEYARKDMTINDILKTVLKDRAFYGNVGGITLSGGEPLIHGEKLIELLKACKENEINTAIETCGYFDSRLLPALSPLTDIMLWDFKDGNDERHLENTGVSNQLIIDNLKQADSIGIKNVLRCIMIKGINMESHHYDAIAELWKNLGNCLYVELIPYHAYGGSKMTALGGVDNGRSDWIPSKEDIETVKKYLSSKGVILK